MTGIAALDLDRIASLADLEAEARSRVPTPVVDYVAGGSWDEVTLAENLEAFRRRRFRQRVLVDTSTVDLSTTLLGQPVAVPLGVAPMAQMGLLHPDGEAAMARAAAAAGAVFCASTVSSRPLEDIAVAGEGPGPRWFQLYVHRDRGLSRSLVERAVEAGYRAIVLTVDLPVLGYRDAEIRRAVPLTWTYGNFTGPGLEGADLDDLIDTRHVTLTWDDLREIASWSDLPLVVKGILVGDDARLAVDCGAAAVIVSNHGGRQLDRTPASLDALPEIVTAVADRAEVYLDGGVRRGTDVVTAIALGARAVFVGRPMAWALGAAGEAGVDRALGILRAETEAAMALLGTPSLSAISPAHLASDPGPR